MQNLILVLLTLFSLSCSNTDNGNTTQPTDGPETDSQTDVLPEVEDTGFDFTATNTEGWELLWEDDFDDNLSDWNIWNGGAFNNELQFYQEDNLTVDDGYLFVRQKRETETGVTTPFDATVKSFNFTSGRVETKQLFSPALEGGVLRIAARIKLPAGAGLWPAFWSYGDPWPTQGEIDIIEFRGNKVNEYVANYFYGVEASMPLTDSSQTTFTLDTGVDLTNEFHVYELEWSENTLVISLDGTPINTFSTAEFQYVDDMFDKSQKIVLNLAVGGNFFNGQNLDVNDIPDSTYMIVDWVKVFKQ
ncbi:glycoside hydrolase family 16 protein [Aggregatimonas sangjinii]|uniref:Glycoside hydrolase family 16 protein n=1 Tax=Aggregatimonas sangjinii TaxID=2583587 RepID=A0A5B7SRB1_9FLAO|nr:glycoside hydrolase family 16 protein [Aggregatimonas sangjinii]QCW99517.1 glycoside hydrolase family 16 protein [Aggregatimonas sangjinii]